MSDKQDADLLSFQIPVDSRYSPTTLQISDKQDADMETATEVESGNPRILECKQ